MALTTAHTHGQPGNSLVPMPRYQKPDPTRRGGMPIGSLLELARKRVGYTEAAVCNTLNITEYELARYESGVRTPTNALLEEFARLYDADFAGDHASEKGRLHLGWADIDLADCTDNDTRLLRIATTLRSIRRVDVDVPLVIRTDEFAVVADALDLTDPDLDEQLGKWLALAPSEATKLAERLRNREE